jgi:hypothetical protein
MRYVSLFFHCMDKVNLVEKIENTVPTRSPKWWKNCSIVFALQRRRASKSETVSHLAVRCLSRHWAQSFAGLRPLQQAFADDTASAATVVTNHPELATRV